MPPPSYTFWVSFTSLLSIFTAGLSPSRKPLILPPSCSTQYSSIYWTLKGQRVCQQFSFPFLHSVPSWALISVILPMQSERNINKCYNIFMPCWTMPSSCCHPYLDQLSFYHLPALSRVGNHEQSHAANSLNQQKCLSFSVLYDKEHTEESMLLTTAYFTSSKLNELAPGEPIFFLFPAQCV